MMNRFSSVSVICAFFLVFLTLITAEAQRISLQGKVVDGATLEPLVGVNIVVEGTTKGTITDREGKFTLSIAESLPTKVVFSFVGYASVEQLVEGSMQNMYISLDETALLGNEVVVSASLEEESILRSPVSIEKLDLAAIERMPSPDFYSGLSSLKGMDMSVHSLLFSVPNARGFNGNTSVRMNQLVDGMDNALPGLGFAAGNIFGVNQLDLESVEFLVGASSALYGPGSMNGTLLMTSKNPFEYQGLLASARLGVMNVQGAAPSANLMSDFNMRYAQVVHKKVAFKLSVGYISGRDWYAADYRDRTDPTNLRLTRKSNPGYDGINVYGDDIIVPVNLKDQVQPVAEGAAKEAGIQLGTPDYDALYQQVVKAMPDQIISRTGYLEKDIVNYNTHNLRINSAVHYRFRKGWESIFQVGYSNGTSVYTSTNRFSLKNFAVFSGKLELKSPHLQVRTYAVFENAGDTYDAANTALLLNEKWKTSEAWYKDYIGSFALTRLQGGSLEEAYKFALLTADNRDRFGNRFNASLPARPLPGTRDFTNTLNSIIKTPINEGGSKVVDRSSMWHADVRYDFKEKIKFVNVIVGGSYRLYAIDSRGTIFIDSPGKPLLISQMGAFAQFSKKIFRDKMHLLASARYDKNVFFKARVTPRFSVVYALDKTLHHNLRASFQTAFRFPTMSDQWLNINTGRYQVIGGQASVQRMHNFDTNPVYPLSSTNPITGVPTAESMDIPVLRPEQVVSWEIGYKGMHLAEKLLVDGYIYRNEYNGFLASQALAQNPGTPEEKRYLTTISTNFPIRTYGWALGVDLAVLKGFLLRGNVNYNTFEAVGTPPKGFQSNFNTPNYRYNVSLHSRGLVKNMDFNIHWRWQQDYLWQSSFGVARIPAFGTLNASVRMKLPKMHSSVTLGGSNVLNQYYTTTLGSAQIGGLYYVTWVFGSI